MLSSIKTGLASGLTMRYTSRGTESEARPLANKEEEEIKTGMEEVNFLLKVDATSCIIEIEMLEVALLKKTLNEILF